MSKIRSSYIIYNILYLQYIKLVRKLHLQLCSEKIHVTEARNLFPWSTSRYELCRQGSGAMSLLWLVGAFRSPAEFERLSGLVIRAFGISRASNISGFFKNKKTQIFLQRGIIRRNRDDFSSHPFNGFRNYARSRQLEPKPKTSETLQKYHRDCRPAKPDRSFERRTPAYSCFGYGKQESYKFLTTKTKTLLNQNLIQK